MSATAERKQVLIDPRHELLYHFNRMTAVELGMYIVRFGEAALPRLRDHTHRLAEAYALLQEADAPAPTSMRRSA